VLIPIFNEYGVLPEGTYECTIEELKERFVTNFKRKLIFEGFLKLIDKLKGIHCKTIYVDGSYVTDKALPSDMDISFDYEEWDFAILMLGADFTSNQEYFKTTYKCNLYPSNLIISPDQQCFKEFLRNIKYSDNKKGILRINL
jgi:hypothetical protein